MKILLTLSLLLLVACGKTDAPPMPEIKEHFMLDVAPMVWPYTITQAIENPQDLKDVKQDIVRCLKFSVTSIVPYRIKYLGEVSIQECHLAGGPKPSDLKLLLLWIEEVLEWADSKKHCIKNIRS